ncbi:thioesterase family protein [Wukongibacter sp. M2B1]|uniref:thioesterase family protein n=1 Tax=Wukongibacter sp. M2B1 TaxID=3088895 RepID=UPI003D78CCC4
MYSINNMLGGLAVGKEITIQKKNHNLDIGDKFDSEYLSNIVPVSVLTSYIVEVTDRIMNENLPEYYMSFIKNSSSCYFNPTSRGMTITITAKIVSITQSNLEFEVTIYDELGMICKAKHVRHIIEKRKFINDANKRLNYLKLNA